MIQLEQISKRYGEKIVLAPADLVFRPGQTSVLMGPSGCGKSTLLRILLGLVEPTAGRVVFQGEPMVPGNLRSIQRRIGYVAQGGALFPHLTVRRNATLPARHLGWSPRRRERRLREVCELAGLGIGRLACYPQELSAGERLRAALVRALMPEPAVLLLDEPLGSLDSLVQSELQRQLRAVIKDSGLVVVIVSHNLSVAARLADRVVLINAGSVVQVGPLTEMIREPADPFVEAFIHAHRELGFEALA